MDFIDSFLNRITVYRLVLYGLGWLVASTIIFAFLGWLPYTALDLSLSVFILLFAARASNGACALFAKATPTPESAYITALILFFILAPLQSAGDALILMLAVAIAMISKYVLAPFKVLIFNPAAFAVFALSIFASGVVVWWVATPLLLPLVILLGFLVVRKMRLASVCILFLLAAMGVVLLKSFFMNAAPGTALIEFFFTTPIIFVGSLMLTEPQTMPSTRGNRLAYGGLAGLLFPLSFTFATTFGTISSSPELALLIGNVYSFLVTRRRRYALRFSSLQSFGRGAYEFFFISDTSFRFRAGQHVDITLAHPKRDTRGIRRSFSISSAPTDPFVRLTTTLPIESSTFKDALRNLGKEATISVTSASGELTLPPNHDQKIAYLAAGIGIAPFISIFRHLALQGERRDMTLIYTAATPLDFFFYDEIESLKEGIGLRTVYLPTGFTELSDWSGSSGYLTNVFLQKEIADFEVRQWYLAGPDVLVRDYTHLLRKMGISGSSIKAEYFPGF
ncbi:hypothetical protein H0X32_02010 [Patescibacteria group bacterium]|nr:hypothetical protein [Patescibacteria group bacterium]